MNKQITKEKLMSCLSTVIDPELDVDIVSLGLIYDVEIEQDGKIVNYKDINDDEDIKIVIRMTLTSPGCPLIDVLEDLVRGSFFGLIENTQENVIINLTFDPPWVIDMMDEEVRLELGL